MKRREFKTVKERDIALRHLKTLASNFSRAKDAGAISEDLAQIIWSAIKEDIHRAENSDVTNIK